MWVRNRRDGGIEGNEIPGVMEDVLVVVVAVVAVDERGGERNKERRHGRAGGDGSCRVFGCGVKGVGGEGGDGEDARV